MKRFFLFSFIALIAASAAVVLFQFARWQGASVATETTVVLAPGTGTRAIFTQLEEASVLPPVWQIAVPLALDGGWRSLKAGEYAFAPGASPKQVVREIAAGKVVVHQVTVPEGFSVAQVRALLLAEPLLTGDVPASIPEGSLFPDTWRFQRGDTRASVIERMQSRMREELAEAWAGREPSLPLSSPEQALVMASLVEEETGVPAERAVVAGVFYNRLRLGIRLQTDPTVAYGIAPGGLGRALTLRDLERDTPYNTYTRTGLPPGPISNPGRAALEAAMHPATTDALYFVATGNGGHRFAATLAEHEANVRAYRAAMRAQAR